jgi:phosphatidylserine decarboxylase
LTPRGGRLRWPLLRIPYGQFEKSRLDRSVAQYPHPLLAREGWPYIAASAVASLVVALFAGWWSLPLWLLTIFIVQFFRDPPREVPAQANAILSPADGRIVKVEKMRDPYTDRDAVLVSVFMNVFNVHSNRSPVDGTVERVEYTAGKFVNADLDKASAENERNALVVRMTSGERIAVVQVAGLIARRILCYVKAADPLARGQRYGFIRFGSRVDVYLPLSARPKVAVGDTVYATTTVLAELAAQS